MEIHFDHIIFAPGQDREITDDDLLIITAGFIDLVEAQGLITGGGAYPCEGKKCEHREMCGNK